MMWANLGDILIPIGRTVAGYVVAFLLAFLGDLLGRLFNLSIGYPWDPAVHQAIIYVSIGLGAGIGSYAAWANPRHPWRMMLLFGLIVVAAGIIGAYLGRIYGAWPGHQLLVAPLRNRPNSLLCGGGRGDGNCYASGAGGHYLLQDSPPHSHLAHVPQCLGRCRASAS